MSANSALVRSPGPPCARRGHAAGACVRQPSGKKERMMRLKDKVALVTGAASGNGRAIARGFAEEGAWVAIVDRNGPGAQAVAEEIRARGGRALAYVGDVADAAAVQTVVRSIETEWGRLNVLVNNAGVGTIFPFLDTD